MKRNLALALILSCIPLFQLLAQCGGIMEPGFAFLTSSRGCAPFTVRIETLYLNAVAGTKYYVNWGDGTPEEIYTQVNPTGVTIQHTYPNTSVDCGYEVTIDASNACNPRGSVVPIHTQVIVWTNDVVSVGPAVYRVCQGFATNMKFTDNSDWNCFPRATRENNEPRWIQWIYGTGPLGNQIPGIKVDGVSPGAFPYLDPDPNNNPIYPVLSPGRQSLSISVPATTPADIGKEFVVQFKNWNQCNPYDNNLTDGNPRNPVNGDLVNGDNPPQMTTARIVIVDAPAPDFRTRLGGSGGPVQNTFCVDDLIYFENQTPPIGGASFQYSWEFYDNNTGVGAPLGTSTQSNPTFTYPTSGQKLIRLHVRDANAAGSCENVIDKIILISPSLIAAIQATDFSDVPITPDFCQEANSPLNTFQVRFHDVSAGIITPTTEWRWEFYDEHGVLIRNEPSGGGFSAVQLGPFDENYTAPGVYTVKLIVRDNVTSCETVDESRVRLFIKPQPEFSFDEVCEGMPTNFMDASSLIVIDGDAISLREWDMSYDGVTFSPDPALNNKTSFGFVLPSGSTQVALRITTNMAGCTDLLSHTVTVHPEPNAGFNADVLSGCSVLTVNFTNTSVAGQPDTISQFQWEIDDHSGTGFVVDSVQSPTDPGFTATYARRFQNTSTSNRQFDVRLRTITIHGCEKIAPVSTITVLPGPGAGFVSSNYDPFSNNCSPVPVHFDVDGATQSLHPSDYSWEIKLGTDVVDMVDTGTDPELDYNFQNTHQSIANFLVTLTATLPSGCSGDSTRMIRVNPVPSSAFVLDTLVYDCDVMRMRLNAVQKGLVEYDWEVRINGDVVMSTSGAEDFLDYEIPRSALLQSVHFELVTGNFAACRSGTSVGNVNVEKKDNMNSSFDATPAHQVLPSATVFLTNHTNIGPWTYHWDFGDGTVSDQRDVSQHEYETYGNYTITLTVSHGVCVEMPTKTIVIDPIPPIIDFDYFPASGCAPLTVTFTNRSRYADPTSYMWHFGENEGSSRAVNPLYTYERSGLYSVTLEATNITGDTVRLTKPLIIDVFDLPISRFDVKPRIINIPGELFTRNESMGATSYLWDFGDGSTSNDFQPSHIYTKEGLFTISLTAINPSGCRDTARLEAGVKAVNSGKILVPNAFSPNSSGPGATPGSGTNDVFLPLLRGVSSFQMQVFNRWGEMLFETRSPDQGWDGYYRGKLCQQDVYVYKITATYDDGNTVTRMGDINLIR